MAAFARPQSEVAKTVEIFEQRGVRTREFATDDLNVFLNEQSQIQENNLSVLRATTPDAVEPSSALVSIRAGAERSPRYWVHIDRAFEAPRENISDLD
jgi:hypothetical protein